MQHYDYIQTFEKNAKKQVDIALDLIGSWVAIRRRITADDDIPRCSCFSTTRTQGDPYCPFCYGTLYEGGYFPTQLVKASIAHEEMDLTMDDPRGLLTVSTVKSTFPSTPKLKERDLIAIVTYDPGINRIVHELRRFVTESINYILWRNVIIGQKVNLTFIGDRDEEMKVPIVRKALDD